MGFSGACYYFSMTENWCPSAAMPQVAYAPDSILERAAGITRALFSLEDRNRKIREAIADGLPVMLVGPRVEMEWGVLCGYTGDGRFYGRSYFDYLKPAEKDIFTDNGYFLADNYPGADPGLICFYHNKTVPVPLSEALKISLETAQMLYTAKPKHNDTYVFGLSAYDMLLDGLRRDDDGFAAITQYGATGNGIILLTRLIDARRAAHAFWAEKAQFLPAANAQKKREASALYAGMVSALDAVLPGKTIFATQNGYPFEAWSRDTRILFADAVETCKQREQQAIEIINDVLKNW